VSGTRAWLTARRYAVIAVPSGCPLKLKRIIVSE
jgi:hypothetical protein